MATFDVSIIITKEIQYTYRIEADDKDDALDQADHQLIDLDNEGTVTERQLDIERIARQLV